ncbi:MAG: hypothetical protein BWK73_09205 [Thiothrix lacustris]|uniref:Toxin-antitoxin system protein n=1 Tax=Thiothrix lacustris TaxID=525917 RepID=A0A1Y1QV19_9GAMM|nr:MAG: hypothetical protein BWK73_09205 [Thiothrix lacustris]
MQTAINRDSPINLRALPTQRALIDRAATLLGKSRSDFMLEIACREAMDVLLDQRLFLLNEQQFQAFEEALSRPLDATQQARVNKLLGTPSPWEH